MSFLFDSVDLGKKKLDEHHFSGIGMMPFQSYLALYKHKLDFILEGLNGRYFNQILRTGSPAFR